MLFKSFWNIYVIFGTVGEYNDLVTIGNPSIYADNSWRSDVERILNCTQHPLVIFGKRIGTRVYFLPVMHKIPKFIEKICIPHNRFV